MNEVLEPLTFEPILRRLLWGGRRLGTMLAKPIGPEADYAESWEIADHREAISRVATGPHSGRTLRELLAERATDILGPGHPAGCGFPLLVKFLDATQTLSVQVHPDDALGAELANDRGKTEAWVILHADPGSLIYAGLRPGVDRAALETALRSNAVEPLLHRFAPRVGDSIFIPAGTVHAIGAGIVLAEVQQMSDATFRLYDWGRVGPDGRPRALHVEESLRAIDFGRGPVDPVRAEVGVEGWGTRERLVACPYFEIERWRMRDRTTAGTSDRFTILIGLDGEAHVAGPGGATELRKGRTVLLPARGGSFEVMPRPSAAMLVVSPGPAAGG